MRAPRSIEQVAGLAEPVLIRPKPRRPVRVPQGWMQEVEAVVDDAADDALATQARLHRVNAGPPQRCGIEIPQILRRMSRSDSHLQLA